MTTIAVIGLGTMGLGIAQCFAQAGFDVLATDTHTPMRDSAADRLAQNLAPRVKAGKLSPEDAAATLAHFTVVPDLNGLAKAALAIEAIVERIEAKQDLFARLEGILAPHSILATNTSSLSVTSLAQGLARPERVLGLHFFNPAPVMRLVELIPHAGSDPQALAKVREWAEAAGKTAITAPDRPGFIVNRCARPFYGEALAMLEAGTPAARIDAAMMAAGYRLGPFALIDLIGADINLAATEGLYAAMDGHPRYFPFAPLRAQVDSGNLGRKTGAGFVFPAEVVAYADPVIALRIEAMLANEALWLLAEGGTTPEGIDTAVKLGLNFPRGPFEMLAQHGATAIKTTLSDLAAQAPDQMKPRYAPAPGL
jgi:3-hydroxybutyryl-CoA dehydrogenase